MRSDTVQAGGLANHRAVAARPRTAARPGEGQRPRLPFPLLESKLSPPVGRPGIVARDDLVERLTASSDVPVVAVVAPPGYGKTTLVMQWAERDPRPFGWIFLDEQDNDPLVLLTYVAVALDRIEPLGSPVFRALASPGASVRTRILPLLDSAVSAGTRPLVLVLDDAHLLEEGECSEAVVALARRLAPGSQLAILSRNEPWSPVARLRAEGRVMELGAEQLAMHGEEAHSLLLGADVDLPETEAAELTRLTEGWPVALYLAALSLKEDGRDDGSRVRLMARERFVVDYLNSELMSRLSRRTVSFLMRTSVLHRMSGPLCDAVLDRSGSAAILASLERKNLLLVPLDRRRGWYRYHHLFRDLLRVELDRRAPGLARQVSLRAAEWCRDNGMPEAAIDYAIEVGAAGLVAELLATFALPIYYSGRVATLERWFAWFDENGLIASYPPVAVLGAWVHALRGRPAAAERWADAVELGSFDGTLPDGAPMWGWMALLRAALCREGMERMRADAELATEAIPVASIWRSTALLILGISCLLVGEVDRADPILTEAVDVAEDAGATTTATVGLAERAILAIERGEWSEAEALAERARSEVAQGHLDDYVTSAIVYAATARVAIHRADVSSAREDLGHAQRLRSSLTYALPFYAVQARLELARAYAALTDAAGARTLLREATDVLRQRPDLGTLPGQAEELGFQLDAIRATFVGASSLTAAELRVLPMLSTQLSFREIGEHLFVSRHTVKTQAISIYRKLGAASRSEAIRRARDLGLLAA